MSKMTHILRSHPYAVISIDSTMRCLSPTDLRALRLRRGPREIGTSQGSQAFSRYETQRSSSSSCHIFDVHWATVSLIHVYLF